MDYTKLFFQFLTVLFPHILYRVTKDFINNIDGTIIEISGYNILINYSLIRKLCLLYPILPVSIYFMFGFKDIYLFVQLYYFFIMYMFILIGDDYDYILLGLSMAVFLSEFWEIPIYVNSYMNGGFVLDNIDSIFAILTIFSKLSMIIYSVNILKTRYSNTYTTIIMNLIIILIGNYYMMFELLERKLLGSSVAIAIRLLVFIMVYMPIWFNVIDDQ